MNRKNCKKMEMKNDDMMSFCVSDAVGDRIVGGVGRARAGATYSFTGAGAVQVTAGSNAAYSIKGAGAAHETAGAGATFSFTGAGAV